MESGLQDFFTSMDRCIALVLDTLQNRWDDLVYIEHVERRLEENLRVFLAIEMVARANLDERRRSLLQQLANELGNLLSEVAKAGFTRSDFHHNLSGRSKIAHVDTRKILKS